jgi:HK97 gp10 family phage protein
VAVRSEFVGLRKANMALRALPEHARVDAQKVMDATGMAVAEGARARVRRRTGTLASAITWRSRPRSVSAVVGVTIGKTIAVVGVSGKKRTFLAFDREPFYWKFLEYGTAKMEARPFMRPAAMAEEPKHRIAIVQALKRSLERAVRQA